LVQTQGKINLRVKCFFGTCGKDYYQMASSVSKSITGDTCCKPKYRLASFVQVLSKFLTEIHVKPISNLQVSHSSYEYFFFKRKKKIKKTEEHFFFKKKKEKSRPPLVGYPHFGQGIGSPYSQPPQRLGVVGEPPQL
jgi:hypothetical protein